MNDSLHQIHELIQRGQGGMARRALKQLAEKRVSREDLPKYAELAWRANVPELGLRLLHPFVRPAPKSPKQATDEERAEYAQCLLRYGALHEAREILEHLEEASLPRVLFYKAALAVAQWDYTASIPLLLRYVKTKGLDPYQKLVAKVNLSAALVFEGDTNRAAPLLRDALHSSSLRGFHLTLGRALEVTAESFIMRREWKAARSFLDEAEEQLRASEGIDELFVRKFQAVVDYLESKGRKAKGLEEIRKEAVSRGHWETVRDCDRLVAVTRKDEDLLARLYFGTPHANYREKLLRDFGKAASLPQSYLWKPSGAGPVAGHIDLLTGEATSKSTHELGAIKPGSLLQRMLIALSSDFYRPLRLVALHELVYPDRFFNPLTSPPLIHDATTRLRKFFEEANIPMAVDESHGFYRLMSTKNFAVRVTIDGSLGTKHGVPLKRLQERWPDRPFSIADAVGILGQPRRSTLRILQNGCSEGKLDRVGSGRSSRYLFRKAS